MIHILTMGHLDPSAVGRRQAMVVRPLELGHPSACWFESGYLDHCDRRPRRALTQTARPAPRFRNVPVEWWFFLRAKSSLTAIRTTLRVWDVPFLSRFSVHRGSRRHSRMWMRQVGADRTRRPAKVGLPCPCVTSLVPFNRQAGHDKEISYRADYRSRVPDRDKKWGNLLTPAYVHDTRWFPAIIERGTL